jgi:methylated-DNA-[protein]-cysteine S-methyltransferase
MSGDPARDRSSGEGVVSLHVKEAGGRWYGLACVGEQLVATAASSTRARTLAHLRRSLRAGIAHRVADERPEFVERTLALLAELEAGREEGKAFSLATDSLGEPLAAVLRAAAAIPLGYVASYGDVGKAAGVEARDVGKIMATNPLYPLVPCHRVVGADLALVGYAGSTGEAALARKLARLVKEARGFEAEREVMVDGRPLWVYPVERAIARAGRARAESERQRKLFE